MKRDVGEPLRIALTLTIKEQTISVKHVFSAFTLYANVLKRVKVPFDEAQQEVHQEEHSLEPAQEKTQTLRLSFFSPKVDFQIFCAKSCISQERVYLNPLVSFCALNTFSCKDT